MSKQNRPLTPHCRRMVMQHAASENMSYDDALEHLVMEGFKAVGYVHNHVHKGGIGL